MGSITCLQLPQASPRWSEVRSYRTEAWESFSEVERSGTKSQGSFSSCPRTSSLATEIYAGFAAKLFAVEFTAP